MKTKRFLLATAGSTVDGRTITPEQIQEMADSYDPKTYAARLNIEHIRGISGDKPFRAYGDVLELSTEMVTVNFNGKDEQRLGLYGVFDVTDDAKALNDAGQKMYPSIEIQDNFAGKGFHYLVGCALTDSPAAIATERLEFARTLPGAQTFARDTAAPLEFADAEQESTGLIAAFTTALDKFTAKFTPAAPPEQKPEANPAPKAGDPAPAVQGLTAADLAPLFTDLGKVLSDGLTATRTEFRQEFDALAVKVKALDAKVEHTPAPGYSARPPASGGATDYSRIF